MLVDAFEVAELGDRAAARIDHDDLIRLVRCDPDVIGRIDDQAVRAVDAVHEDFGSAGCTGILTTVSLPVLATNIAVRALLKAMPLAPNGGTPVVPRSGLLTHGAGAPPAAGMRQMVARKESET